MASLSVGKVTPGAHWKPGGITAQQSGTPAPPQWLHSAGWGGDRPRIKPWADGTYGRDPRYGTRITTEKEAQDLMDPRTPEGQGLQYWAETEARKNREAMIAEFRKRMMRDM